MATYQPVRESVDHFARRYIDESFGFSLGWTYFYDLSMTFCAELLAVVTIIQYWDTKANTAVWIALGLVVDLTLNVFAVKWVLLNRCFEQCILAQRRRPILLERKREGGPNQYRSRRNHIEMVSQLWNIWKMELIIKPCLSTSPQ